MKRLWIRLILFGLLAAAAVDVYKNGMGRILEQFIETLVVLG